MVLNVLVHLSLYRLRLVNGPCSATYCELNSTKSPEVDLDIYRDEAKRCLSLRWALVKPALLKDQTKEFELDG